MVDGQISAGEAQMADDGTASPSGVVAFSKRLPARASEVGVLRRAVAGWLGGAPTARSSRHGDALLVVSELFTNAVEAGAHEVDTLLWRSGSLLRIVVTDDGPDWLPTRVAPAIPHPTAGRGRGLALASLVGRLDIDRIDERTRVMVTMEPV